MSLRKKPGIVARQWRAVALVFVVGIEVPQTEIFRLTPRACSVIVLTPKSNPNVTNQNCHFQTEDAGLIIMLGYSSAFRRAGERFAGHKVHFAAVATPMRSVTVT